MNVRRSRIVGAPREAVWAVVGDPHQLPRWWPRTERVEGVGPGEWTSVLRSERGSASTRHTASGAAASLRERVTITRRS